MPHRFRASSQYRVSRFSRRAFLRSSALAILGTALGACGDPQGSRQETPAGAAHIVYQDWRTDWFPPLAQEALQTFHQEHQDVSAIFVPDPEDFTAEMLADFEAGTAPDVFQGCCAHFAEWAQKGFALDLRPYVEADLDQSTIDDWNPAQYQSLFLPGGLQFGVPKYHGGLALFYNKDMFDAQSLAYPDETWDHDDYAEAMQALTVRPDAGAGSGVWGSMLDVSWERIQVHVNAWGGHLVDPDDPTHCMMSEPEAMQALEWLRARMWDDKTMATPLDVQNLSTRDAFITQRIAMVEDGSWALKDILSNADFRIGVAPFPAGPARRVTLASTDGFGIFAGTKQPDAAWELVKFLISKEYGRAMARANFLQPARKSLIDDWIASIRDQYPQKAEDIDLAAFADGHIKGYSVTGEVFTNMADAKMLTYAAWDAVLAQGSAPVSRMQDVCQQIDALGAKPR